MKKKQGALLMYMLVEAYSLICYSADASGKKKKHILFYGWSFCLFVV